MNRKPRGRRAEYAALYLLAALTFAMIYGADWYAQHQAPEPTTVHATEHHP